MSVSRHIIRRFGTSQHILKNLKPIDINTTTNKTIKTQEVQQQNEFQRTLQLLKSKLDASKNIKTGAVEGMVTEDNKKNKYSVRKSFRDEDLVDLKDNINLVFHENVIFNSPDFLDTLNTEIINKFPEIEFHKDEIRDQFKLNINQYFKKSENQQLILKKRGKEKILKEIIRNIYWPFFVNNTDEAKSLNEFKFLVNEKLFINHICEIIINNYRINNKFENYLKKRNINKQRINNDESRIFFLNDLKWDYYLFNFNQFNNLKNLIFKLNKINSFNSSNNASNIKLINIENNISDNNKFKLKLLSENSDVISNKLNINSNNSTSLFISNDKDVSLEYFKMVKFLQSNHKNDNFKVVYIQENKSGYRSGTGNSIDRGDDYDRYQFILNSSREDIPDKFDIVKNSEIYENLIKSQDLVKLKKLKDQIKEENYLTVKDISQIDILTSILNS
ncbi:hypothetical protein B5S33_g1423 [[Candida] boidinii]|nr:hypothetical protein B5S33_g1423 [[Candida] boidinii]